MENQVQLLMGNEAIGRGLLEAGCQVAAAYPGTPSTEVLQAVIDRQHEAVEPLHIEWSVNEKIAFEVALAASYTGKRAAAVMKQVGLNVAADAFMRTAYLGVKGGLVAIVADDPGPHSSQNEQDTRLFCLSARVPVLDPSTPAEAKAMVAEAFQLSEEYEVPVVLRPTTRICHSRQNVALAEPVALGRRAAFQKDPARWAATPAFLPALHRQLNDKLEQIARDPRFQPKLTVGDDSLARTALVASGIVYGHLVDLLDELGLSGRYDLFQVTMPYPLSPLFIEQLHTGYDRVLVLEETYPVIEMQLAHAGAVGRHSGAIPREGEMTPDLVHRALADFLGLPQPAALAKAAPGRRPSLCAGCPHRTSFYAIKKTFPKGIYPSDIGCYTLGINLKAVDTAHCMGACISQGAGFYQAYAQDGDFPTVVVTIGDSTFFHAGLPALVNAVIQQARIIVVILDNATAAMTGGQPVPHLGWAAGGRPTRAVAIEPLVRAAGVDFLEVCDPYDQEQLEGLLRQADDHIRSPQGGVAVIISRHGCLMDKAVLKAQARFAVTINDACVGCRKCVDQFECPAMSMDEVGGRALIDQDRCVGCGTCIPVCPVKAIIKEAQA
ncbi:indolepyruvate ferredoxin oxidoreductase subunit alpha [Desulfuromonas sp. KJ2020]|uniref:thiamine pyrophosphate-dependent enzyme n=1 Tax=Desulfuromonas sp. KJ2020 TaxID=2919173 RepID=UPI0020A7DD19|nr:thiamine pyrophosphate-dependent enzyme [Desulfuromonas sp. KJ2020]MCP3175564.1 indolepyruvate ferredoxin oxidoreductase subunit alpha [Desulfuromonas sp. KJ2020]